MSEQLLQRVEIESVLVGHAGGRQLSADLYRPPVANGGAVLLIHGGGFVGGDRRQLRGYGIYLGRLGYTCLACEYRLAGESRWPAQLEDVNSALAWLHSQSEELGFDDRRLAVSGNSAGGHLALMAAAEGRMPIAAVTAFYPPTDFLSEEARRHGSPSSMRFLLGDDVSEERVRLLSPINHVRKDLPPIQLITGNRDETVSVNQSLDMYRALIAAGARAELHVFEGAPHAFDVYPPFGRQCASLIALFLERYAG